MSDREPRDIRLKRLAMRSMRRGIKEMDLILMAYSQGPMVQLSDADLDVYEDLLNENDQDLYAWVTGQQETPSRFSALMSDICSHFGVD